MEQIRVILHDLPPEVFKTKFTVKENDFVFNALDGKLTQCLGCFQCWVKTPGQCVIQDDYRNVAEKLCQSKEFIIVSKCVYGGYSPRVKNVFDRSIGYLLPYFTYREDKKMHHKIRVDAPRKLSVHFYGSMTEKEKETARGIVKGNALNIHAASSSVSFYPDYTAIGREIL